MEENIEAETIETDLQTENSYNEPTGNNIGIEEKPAIEKFFDTENILHHLEMTWKGYVKVGDEWEPNGKNAIARDEFINNTINSLRSVINGENMISKMAVEEIEYVLLEKNLEFCYAAHDEPTVDEDDYETFANQFDHALQLFMGLILNGHGANVLTQIYAGLHQPNNESDRPKTFLESIARDLNRGKNNG